MVDKQKNRVENVLQKVVDDLEKSYLRKMQGDMHKCAAVCCDNLSSSTDQVINCVEECGLPFQRARNYVRTELENFQYRLQRCVMTCNDQAKDKLSTNPTDKEINDLSREFETCALACVDKHISIIPNFVAKMKEVLQKGF